MSSNEIQAVVASEAHPMTSTTQSATSSLTHVHNEESKVVAPRREISSGHGGSALPEDKFEEAIENIEEDWENDPENPRNWIPSRKWTAVGVVSFYTFCSPLASSMMAPGIPEIAMKYGIRDPTVIALTLSIFLLSFAFGPLILAPLSEMYGRTWVLHLGNLFTMGFSFGCAFAPTTGSLIAFRLLSGLGGSAPIACGGGTVGDLFSERDRASAMALFILGPLVALCGVAACIGIPVLRETYAPVIRMRRAAKSGDLETAKKAHPHLLQEHGSKLHVLWVNLARPTTILMNSPIAFILSLYTAFIYGIFYLMFATFAQFFATTYGFKAGVGGLAYLGLGIGFATATVVGAKSADQIYKHLANKNGGIAKPEMRIPALFFGSFFVPVGIFWYGWSAHAKLHWIMPIIGSGIFAFGMMTTFLPVQLYLVDSFAYAASATSANALFRSLLGFAFPLFGQQMFDKLGLGPGNSLLAGLAILLGIPFPVWLYFNGERLRASNALTRDSTIPKQLK
ncbi:multidrug resistance protein 4 [Panaeolus papilionaceus]|nr:multidrug resistance protein 4 [Panaeolus papilionaceus]